MVDKSDVGALLDALKRARREVRGFNRLTDKQKAIAEYAEHKYSELRRSLRQTGQYAALTCTMLIHRIRMTVSVTPRSAFPWAAIGAIPGARVGRGRMLFKQQYSFTTSVKGIHGLETFTIESDPTNGYAAPFRITIVPKGPKGLQWEYLRAVLEILPNFKIVLVEAAWDFPLTSIIDIDYIRNTDCLARVTHF